MLAGSYSGCLTPNPRALIVCSAISSNDEECRDQICQRQPAWCRRNGGDEHPAIRVLLDRGDELLLVFRDWAFRRLVFERQEAAV
jgi:hypothetical protein